MTPSPLQNTCAPNRGIRPRILVVEDDFDLRHALRTVLLQRDMQVMTTWSGTDAIQLLDHEQFDVVVSDVRIEGASGLDVAAKVHYQYPETKVIIITAYPDWHVFNDAHEMSVWKLVTKPFRLSTLASAVHRATRASGER